MLALLPAVACLPLQAQAPGGTPAASASATTPIALPPCDKAVRFSAAWFADPEVDNGKSAAELTQIGARAGGGKAGGSGDVQLGHVVVETQLTVVPQTGCRGAVVQLAYVKPVLRVAREFASGTCPYARVMTHEQTHVRIHRDIARQFRELVYPWPGGASSAALLAWSKQELDRLMRAQELFDSPEEYARNTRVCGGEIARLVKPDPAPAKPAGKPG